MPSNLTMVTHLIKCQNQTPMYVILEASVFFNFQYFCVFSHFLKAFLFNLLG